MKVAVALTTNRLVQPQTVLSIANMLKATNEETFFFLADKGYTIAENRSYAVVQAQKNGCTHLLFVDDDMVFPPDTLDRLLELRKEIVGVLSYSRVLPLSPTVGLMNEKGEYKHPEKYPAFEMKMPSEPFKAYFVGGGVLLIDMDVFDKLEKPYFAFTANEDGKVIEGEDGYFCLKARKAGIDVWCEPRLEILHLGTYAYGKSKEN